MKLTWGCGSMQPEGWVGSDLEDHGQDHVGDIVRDGLPWSDGTFEIIVANHSLQALGYHDLVPALCELRRVLAPGGVLRILVPDIVAGLLARRTPDGGFLADVVDATEPSTDGKFCAWLTWFGTNATVFLPPWLIDLCMRAGFSSAGTTAWGVTKTRWAASVELDDRRPESFVVEAVR